MISSVSDYHYVTGVNVDDDHPLGDMDRILIDGDIMPLREGTLSPTTGVDRSLILRGEDITFLIESYQERSCFWKSIEYAIYQSTSTIDNTAVDTPVEFTRKLSRNQVYSNLATGNYYNYLFSDLSSFHSSYNNSFGLIGNPVEGVVPIDSPYISIEYAVTSIWGDILSLRSDYKSHVDLADLNAISKQTIRDLFDNLTHVTHIAFGLQAGISLPADVVYSEGQLPARFSRSTWKYHNGNDYLYYIGCSSTRAFRVEIDSNVENIADDYELFVCGHAHKDVNGSETGSKYVIKKMSNGSVVHDGDHTYVDFYVTISKSEIDALYSSCGFDLPQRVLGPDDDVVEAIFAFDCVAVAKFTDRTIWSSDS